MSIKELKAALLEHCRITLHNRYAKVKQTIADIDESLLEEDKNSSGDKHETGRAMLQIDRENAGKQLKEIENVQELFKKIDIDANSDYVRLGSLVYTSQANYFISISVGAVIIGKTSYLCVSRNSPIGEKLSGLKKGDHFQFNEKTVTVTAVR
jgi:transcription elongation GreA/GreB family factor